MVRNKSDNKGGAGSNPINQCENLRKKVKPINETNLKKKKKNQSTKPIREKKKKTNRRNQSAVDNSSPQEMEDS